MLRHQRSHMTIQKRTLVAPDDIIGLEFECNTCHARYTLPVISITRCPSTCPNCNEPWIRRDQPSTSSISDLAIIGRLAEFLSEIKVRRLGATIRLEIVGESTPSVSQT